MGQGLSSKESIEPKSSRWDKSQERQHANKNKSMQLLNVIRPTPKNQAKGLLIIKMTIREKITNTTVNNSASPHVISIEEAQRLRIKGTSGGLY